MLRFVLALALGLFAAAPAAAQYVPSGSYQQSCVNIHADASTLIASCTAANGTYVTSTFPIGSCRGEDIANVNGYLRCNPKNGGGFRPVPAGSYQQSCVNVHIDGGMLEASCTAPNGQYVRSELPLGSCRGGDIANANGYLQCGAGGGAYPNPNNGSLPSGSYQASCRYARMRGDRLNAQCTATNGAWITSSLDVDRCQRGTDVANIDGRLECLSYR